MLWTKQSEVSRHNGMTTQMTEEELDKLFDDMRLGPPPVGGEDSLLPMMETMMQSLLSKDLLYPAIRDLADKYPGWLAEKGGQLAPEELEKFKRQYELSKQVLHSDKYRAVHQVKHLSSHQIELQFCVRRIS